MVSAPVAERLSAPDTAGLRPSPPKHDKKVRGEKAPGMAKSRFGFSNGSLLP
jgi:hypothetical protein